LLGNNFSGPHGPTYRAVAINGLPAAEFDGVLEVLPGPALSGLITSSAYTLFAVATINTILTNDNTSYANAAILSDDGGGYFGLHLRNSPTRAVAYNWNGGDQSVILPFSLGVPTLFTQQHGGNVLSLAINGGTPGTIASGNTDDLSSPVMLGQGSGAMRPAMMFSAVIIYNRAIDAGDVSKVETYLKHKYAIS